MRQGPISSLGANPLNTTLVLVEVNVTDHLVVLNTTSDVIDSVMAILIVIELGGVQNHRRLLLIQSSREERTRNVIAHDFERRNNAKGVLLVFDFLKTKLLYLSDGLEMSFRWPLEIIFIGTLVVHFKHVKLPDRLLG